MTMTTKKKIETEIQNKTRSATRGRIRTGIESFTSSPRREAAWLSCLSLAGVIAAGCAAPGADSPGASEGETETHVSESLYGLNNIAKKWPNGVVPVCFKSLDDHFDLQNRLKPYLNASWSNAANINFNYDYKGSGSCTDGSDHVNVVFADPTRGACTSDDDCAKLGYQCVRNVCDRYRGNTDKLGAGQPTVTLISNDPLSNTLLGYQVVHEFGHALGFAHEMQRPDNWTGAPQQCPVNPKDLQNYASWPGGLPLTLQYDADSIMNYCGPNGNLSAGDVIAVSSAQAYGSHQGCNFVSTVATCTPTWQLHAETTYSLPAGCLQNAKWVLKRSDGYQPSHACPNGAQVGSCLGAEVPSTFTLGWQAEGAVQNGPAIGTTQSYSICDRFNNCGASFSISIPDCRTQVDSLYMDPSTNPITVTQGGVNEAYLLMEGAWIAKDQGVGATGSLVSSPITGLDISFVPGVALTGKAAVLMAVKAQLTIVAGNYSVTARVADRANGAIKTVVVPIRVLSCAPSTPASACHPSLPGNEAACGTVALGCGLNTECGLCAAGSSCSLGYCCPAGKSFSREYGSCIPNCTGGLVNCFVASGECMTAAACQAFDTITCHGRSCS
jgi:hypothetical protein